MVLDDYSIKDILVETTRNLEHDSTILTGLKNFMSKNSYSHIYLNERHVLRVVTHFLEVRTSDYAM